MSFQTPNTPCGLKIPLEIPLIHGWPVASLGRTVDSLRTMPPTVTKNGSGALMNELQNYSDPTSTGLMNQIANVGAPRDISVRLLGLDTIADVYKKVRQMGDANNNLAKNWAESKASETEALKNEKAARSELKAYQKEAQAAMAQAAKEANARLVSEKNMLETAWKGKYKQKVDYLDNIIKQLKSLDTDYLQMEKYQVEISRLTKSLDILCNGCRAYNGKTHQPGKLNEDKARVATVSFLLGRMTEVQGELTKLMLSMTAGIEKDAAFIALPYVENGLVSGHARPWWAPLADVLHGLTNMCTSDDAED